MAIKQDTTSVTITYLVVDDNNDDSKTEIKTNDLHLYDMATQTDQPPGPFPEPPSEPATETDGKVDTGAEK